MNMDIPYIKTGESEIDSLVVEELFSSPDFRQWFLEKIGVREQPRFVGAWKSFPGRYGECDIAAEFIAGNKSIIVLVENKIYSPEQPEQAERYHKTGKYMIEREGKDKYITCLLSPKIYFKENAPMESYEYRISYESLLEWFKKQDNSDRIKFKQMVIQNGIDRARTGYTKITDENTDKFYEYYEELAREYYPELEYAKPKTVASGNSWIRFNPKTLPAKTTIIHKANQGYVDLQLPENSGNFSKDYKSKLKEKMSMHSTGKSKSIRIITPKILGLENIDEPEEYREKIITALNSAKQLLDWYTKTISNNY